MLFVIYSNVLMKIIQLPFNIVQMQSSKNPPAVYKTIIKILHLSVF